MKAVIRYCFYFILNAFKTYIFLPFYIFTVLQKSKRVVTFSGVKVLVYQLPEGSRFTPLPKRDYNV